jgi:hypothetical protein
VKKQTNSKKNIAAKREKKKEARLCRYLQRRKMVMVEFRFHGGLGNFRHTAEARACSRSASRADV